MTSIKQWLEEVRDNGLESTHHWRVTTLDGENYDGVIEDVGEDCVVLRTKETIATGAIPDDVYSRQNKAEVYASTMIPFRSIISASATTGEP